MPRTTSSPADDATPRCPPNREDSPAPPDEDDRSTRTGLLPTTTEVPKSAQNIWLTRTVLFAFATVFVSSAIALVGLSRLVSSQNGLPLWISSSHCLLGGLLTVIVSGLWVVGDPVLTHSATQVLAGTWDRAWLSASNTDHGVAAALNMLRHGGVTTPPSIREDYIVLPRVTLLSSPSSTRNLLSAHNATVLKPALECTTLPPEGIAITKFVTQSPGMRPGMN